MFPPADATSNFHDGVKPPTSKPAFDLIGLGGPSPDARAA